MATTLLREKAHGQQLPERPDKARTRYLYPGHLSVTESLPAGATGGSTGRVWIGRQRGHISKFVCEAGLLMNESGDAIKG